MAPRLYEVEKNGRLVKWRINNLFDHENLKEPYGWSASNTFRMGNWDWHLEILEACDSELKLCCSNASSTGENFPIVTCNLRVICSGGEFEKESTQWAATDQSMSRGFCQWHVDLGILYVVLVYIEFIDLQIDLRDGRKRQSVSASDSVTNWLSNQRSLSLLNRMWTEKIETDIKIVTSNGDTSAHRAILVAYSPVFNKLFTHDLIEKKTSTIEITDMTLDECEVLFRYIYGNLSKDEFMSYRHALLRAADKYDISELRLSCEESFMEDIIEENVFEMFEFACLNNLNELKRGCKNYLLFLQDGS